MSNCLDILTQVCKLSLDNPTKSLYLLIQQAVEHPMDALLLGAGFYLWKTWKSRMNFYFSDSSEMSRRLFSSLLLTNSPSKAHRMIVQCTNHASVKLTKDHTNISGPVKTVYNVKGFKPSTRTNALNFLSPTKSETRKSIPHWNITNPTKEKLKRDKKGKEKNPRNHRHTISHRQPFDLSPNLVIRLQHRQHKAI